MAVDKSRDSLQSETMLKTLPSAIINLKKQVTDLGFTRLSVNTSLNYTSYNIQKSSRV